MCRHITNMANTKWSGKRSTQRCSINKQQHPSGARRGENSDHQGDSPEEIRKEKKVTMTLKNNHMRPTPDCQAAFSSRNIASRWGSKGRGSKGKSRQQKGWRRVTGPNGLPKGAIDKQYSKCRNNRVLLTQHAHVLVMHCMMTPSGA